MSLMLYSQFQLNVVQKHYYYTLVSTIIPTTAYSLWSSNTSENMGTMHSWCYFTTLRSYKNKIMYAKVTLTSKSIIQEQNLLLYLRISVVL